MNHEVVIISAFGRGNWLATELKRAKIDCALIDVSESLGRSVPEENEGPFGFFNSEKILESQWERLIEDDPPQPVNQGFTLWLSDGPIEFKSPLVKHCLNQRGVPSEVTEAVYASDYSEKKISQLPFAQSWLLHLSHALFSTIFTRNNEAGLIGERAPLFNNFIIRQASRQGISKSLDWCRRNEVMVYDRVRLLDGSQGLSSSLQGIEIQAGGDLKSEFVTANQFVLCLSSEELEYLTPEWAKKLFPRGARVPDWHWCRYGIKVSAGHERDQLPVSMLIVDDLELPWSHENFLFVQRTMSPELMDVWIRIPTSQRFHRQYIEERGKRLLSTLRKRLSLVEVDLNQYPMGYDATFADVGPVRHPLFSLQQKMNSTSKKLVNLIWDGPEQWTHLGWNGQLRHQYKIFENLQKWWIKQQEKKGGNK